MAAATPAPALASASRAETGGEGSTALGISGLRKAAILITVLGPERAAPMLRSLSEAELEPLAAEIVRVRATSAAEAAAVLQEFCTMAGDSSTVRGGGLAAAQESLARALGPDRAGEIMVRLTATVLNQPFLFLQQADALQLEGFLTGEHPQTIALVLAHLLPHQASQILGILGPEVAADVAHRIGVMDSPSQDAVRLVEELVRRRTSSVIQVSTEASSVGGVDLLVDIVNRSDRATERQILEGLAGRDSVLADQVRQRLFVFEDLTTLEDRAVQLVLRQVETGDLATALKGVRPEVKDVVTRNLSDRARQDLLEEIDLMGPVRASAVEEAQTKVVQVIRRLEESGEIELRRGGDDDDALVE